MQSTPIAVEGWVGVLLVLVAGSPGRGLVFGESAGFGLVLSLVNHVASVDGVPVNDVGCSEAAEGLLAEPTERRRDGLGIDENSTLNAIDSSRRELHKQVPLGVK